MNTSDTPRTDAECGWYDPNGIRYPHPTGDHVDPDFARQLERELATVTANALALSQSNAELRSRIRRLEEAGDKLHWAFMHPFDPARYDLPKLWIEAKAKP